LAPQAHKSIQLLEGVPLLSVAAAGGTNGNPHNVPATLAFMVLF